jgi:long-chain acyl-CoA synthetase
VFPVSLEEDIKLNHYIENAMIYGEGREYNICIVVPDFIALEKWARKNNMPEEPAQLVKSDEARSFLTNEIVTSLKGKYGSYEIPKKFIFLSEAFNLENGTLTQTMRLKRGVVFEKYKDQIAALYS